MAFHIRHLILSQNSDLVSPDGGLNITGTFDTLNTPALPATLAFCVSTVVTADDPNDLGVHGLSLRILDPQDGLVLQASQDNEVPFDRSPVPQLSTMTFVVKLGGVPFTTTGIHRVEACIDGVVLGSHPLLVKLQADGE